MKGYPINRVVSELIGFNFTGNVVPRSWYEVITRENGKAYPLAILILAETVYWYRPIEVKNEHKNGEAQFAKKFSADKWQISYRALADKFCVSKGQIKTAIKRLESLGIIDCEFRNIHVAGQILNNVLFIGLNVEMFKSITSSQGEEAEKTDTVISEKPNRSLKKSIQGYVSSSIGVELNQQTNTEITQRERTDSNENTAADAVASPNAMKTFSPAIQENYQILKRQGVNGINLKELAQLPGLTPEILHQEIIPKCQSKKGGAGLLVNLLRNWATEQTNQRSQQDRSRYISGEYADYIEH